MERMGRMVRIVSMINEDKENEEGFRRLLSMVKVPEEDGSGGEVEKEVAVKSISDHCPFPCADIKCSST